MPRRNVIFVIVTPLVLMAIIAVAVVVVGEALLAMHHWAHHAYHIGDYPTPEENRYWREIAALYPVSIALGLSTLFLVGGIIASKLAPQPPASSSVSSH
jgi:hypothetical protein